jgi:exopolyphosphatase/guanosine-5'-triphosphate,3'-diphosphate pyrophosphatase
MTTAVIDLGTNTFNLLIKDDFGRVVFNDKIPVKLGKGGIHENKIAPDAFERGISALLQYRDICKEKGVHQVYAFATSAVRTAANGPDFVAAAAERCGIHINVIDGHREALFIYEGVAQAVHMDEDPALIVDIGGGSTEMVIATNKGVLWAASYPLGVSRLFENFSPKDPLRLEDYNALQTHFKVTLHEALRQIAKYKPMRMVGSSGSFETLHNICALHSRQSIVQPEQKRGVIAIDQLEVITQKLRAMSHKERLALPGMLSMRADTIHLAAMQIQFIIRQTGVSTLLLSLYALKEGVLASLNKSKEQWLISSL